MLWIKILLMLAMIFLPCHLIFTLPFVSPVVVLLVIGFWMVVPGWGPWIYAGICGSLIQWRIWLISQDYGWRSFLLRPRSVAVDRCSPSLINQNVASAWLMIGGIAGAVRSWYAADSLGALIGLIVAIGLLLLQGILFRAE
jgi:hypothetical protein